MDPITQYETYYEDMWNDLTKGPGPKNEVVKIVNAIGDGLGHLGGEIEKEAERRESNIRERVKKPLEQPGKTLECLATFGNC